MINRGTIILLIVFILLGIIIVILRRYTGKNAVKNKKQVSLSAGGEAEETDLKEKVTAQVSDVECCGAHEICEKTGKYNPQFKPDYYDDEELDAYKGIAPEDYTEEQIAEFDEILLTMKEGDVSGWLRSLQLRGIELPYSVREKAIMIIG